MPYSVLAYGTRKAGLSLEEFKEHYENKHIPLIKSLIGDLFPVTHVRYYVGRDGEGAPRTVMGLGQASDFAWDGVAVLTFKDEEHFNKAMAVMGDEEKAKALAADEEKFVDRSSLRMVVLGDVRTTVNESMQ